MGHRHWLICGRRWEEEMASDSWAFKKRSAKSFKWSLKAKCGLEEENRLQTQGNSHPLVCEGPDPGREAGEWLPQAAGLEGLNSWPCRKGRNSCQPFSLVNKRLKLLRKVSKLSWAQGPAWRVGYRGGGEGREKKLKPTTSGVGDRKPTRVHYLKDPSTAGRGVGSLRRAHSWDTGT